MKTRITNTAKYIILLSLTGILSEGILAQSKNNSKPTFDEKAVKNIINEMKKAGIPETEYEGYINFKRAEFEGIQNGTWNKLISYKTDSTIQGCVNSDFSDSTFNGWVGSTGCHPNATSPASCNGVGCCPTTGIVAGRHEIISTQGTDACGGFPLIPAGRKVVAKLGNNLTGSQAEQLSKTFKVTEETSGFTYWYALVLQNPTGHTSAEKPAFSIIMTETLTGDTIPCSYYFVSAGEGIPGFVNSTACTGVIYKPWSTVTLDLNNYIGKLVTIKFTTYDCSLSGHYGYAYISSDCFKSEIPDPYFCDGWNPDTTLNLTAPSGYSSYKWLKNGVDSVANTQGITIDNPKLGDNYTVILTPFHTGNDSCGISLNYQIKLKPHPILPEYCPKQNVFTPNQDKMNEKFVTHDYAWISKFNIKIFDRWGKLMFESNDPYIEWDGKTKDGGKADDGVYYWHATYVSACYPNPEEPGYKDYKCHGFLHLLR